MTLFPSSGESPRRPSSSAAIAALVLASIAGAFACGAPSSAPAKSPAEAPQTPAAAPPPAGAPVPVEESSTATESEPESAPSDMPASAGREKSYADIDDIDALSRSLDRTLRLSVPDCSSAASLRDRICDLAQRICNIAARSAEPEVEARCTDGKRRCERATASVRGSCSD